MLIIKCKIIDDVILTFSSKKNKKVNKIKQFKNL